MSVVIDLSDRALSIARDGVLLALAPSVVRSATAGGGQAGESMLGRERIAPTEVSTEHWISLARGARGLIDEPAAASGDTPTGDSLALRTAAAELAARAAHAGLTRDSGVEMLTAAPFDARNLGAVLALAAAAGLRVTGFRDAAVVAAAALNVAGDALVVELGLHHCAVTRVSRVDAGWARSGQRLDTQAGGQVDLQQQWMALAAEAFVRRTRFDPLHDAATEQQLHDALPAAVAQAATAGQAQLGIRGPVGRALSAELTRDQLALPVQAFMRSLLRQLHALRPAGATVTLILPLVLAQAPGIDAVLAEFQGCELIAMPDGLAAQALSAALASGACAPATPGVDGSVQLLRRIAGAPSPRPESAMPGAATEQGTLAHAAAAVRRTRIGGGAPQPAPTHLLYAGRALPIGTQPLEIGRGAAGARMLGLPEGLAGVSRLHCSLRREGSQVLLVDHSRHGSFINGERVSGSAVLHAGDTLRVGDPGVEMAMIAVTSNTTPGERHAPSPSN